MMPSNDKYTFSVPAAQEVVAPSSPELELARQAAIEQATPRGDLDPTAIDTRRVEYGATAVAASTEASVATPDFYNPKDYGQMLAVDAALKHIRDLGVAGQ